LGPAGLVKNHAPFISGPTSTQSQRFDSRDSKAAMPAALKDMFKKIDRFGQRLHVVSTEMRVSHDSSHRSISLLAFSPRKVWLLPPARF
jgi:hypothetical protein